MTLHLKSGPLLHLGLGLGFLKRKKRNEGGLCLQWPKQQQLAPWKQNLKSSLTLWYTISKSDKRARQLFIFELQIYVLGKLPSMFRKKLQTQKGNTKQRKLPETSQGETVNNIFPFIIDSTPLTFVVWAITYFNEKFQEIFRYCL